MGTDSLSTQVGTGPNGQLTVVKSYSHTPKLFELPKFSIGVCAWGAGNIGTRSIGGLVTEFGDSLRQRPATIQDAAQQLGAFISTFYNQAFSTLSSTQQPILGFFVGGYSTLSPLAEMWVIRFPSNPISCTQMVPTTYFGAAWDGVPLPFIRLQKGIDPRIITNLLQQGVPQQAIDQACQGMESSVLFDSMPVKQAIDYCEFLLNTTIGFTQFEMGVPLCGEPLQVAVITQKNGFKWVDELSYHW
jgi:hypothetical protein